MHFSPRATVTILGAALALVLSVLGATPAWADHTIQIDPGAYAGRYYTPGGGWLTGAQAVSLAEGQHEIYISTGASFDAKGHRKSLCNEIARILRFIEKEQLDQAAQHLVGAIERVDGCTLRGTPDPKGKGQPNAADHLVDCADQIAVYDLLTDALAAFP